MSLYINIAIEKELEKNIDYNKILHLPNDIKPLGGILNIDLIWFNNFLYIT